MCCAGWRTVGGDGAGLAEAITSAGLAGALSPCAESAARYYPPPVENKTARQEGGFTGASDAAANTLHLALEGLTLVVDGDVHLPPPPPPPPPPPQSSGGETLVMCGFTGSCGSGDFGEE